MENCKELVNALRERASWLDFTIHHGESKNEDAELMKRAANFIEELLKAASAMHLWIFLNTGDEQKAYDECGLSDEMNAALGYGGQYIMEVSKGNDDG